MKKTINWFMPFMAIILLTLVSVFSMAQSGIIKGIVKDASGAPLSGASVTVEPKNIGTTTDATGNYSFKVPAGSYRLVISFVGQATERMAIIVKAGETLEQNIGLVTAGDGETIMVVGSRNPKRTSTESAVPVDVIPLKQIMNQVGQLDVNQLLTFLAPSFNSTRQAISDGTDHIDPGQLRGLGPDQVLILLNGKRYHQSSLVNVNGTVNRGTVGTDMSSIPASSIERIEILRDGASAQYGSDAIAGVINIVLKRNTGLTINVSGGESVTTYNKNYAWNILNPTNQLSDKTNITDGKNFQVALNYGIPMKKGYLEVSGEYLYRGSTNRTGLFTGQIWDKVNGIDKSDSINTAKGLTRNNFDMIIGNSEIKGGGAVVNFGYPISKNLDVYAFGVANFKKGYAGATYRYPFAGTISSNTTVSAAVEPNFLALYPNGFLPQENSSIQDYTSTAGVRGKLGSWHMDISETFGLNNYTFLVANSMSFAQAAVAGTTPSQLQTSFNSGSTNFKQSTTNVDFSKNHQVLQGLNTAVGAEFRIDNYSITEGEPLSYNNPTNNSTFQGVAGAQSFPGFFPSNAGSWSRNSFSVYSDNELDVTKKWLISGALRYEHFSDFGSTLNYKFSTRYKLTDWLSLRGSTSSGFRAPSMQQEHYSKVNTLFQTVGGVLTPVQAGTFTNNSSIATILGIPTLKQETSISYSVGATAKIAKGFDVTVDAYQIDIDNRIVLTNSFSGNGNAALQAQLNAAGAATASVFTNGINTRSQGIEGVLTYTKRLDSKQSINITLSHSSIQNRVKKGSDDKPIIHGSDILTNSGQLGRYFTREDQARIESESPQQKDIFTLQYKYSKFGAMLRFTYFGKVTYQSDTTTGFSPPSANLFHGGAVESLDQIYGAKVISDLSVNYAITPKVNFVIGANNLFDVYPDQQTHSGNVSSGRYIYSRRVSQFGFNGRFLFARVSFDLGKLTKKP